MATKDFSLTNIQEKLPIFKHFDTSQIDTSGKNLTSGQKNLSTIIKLGLLGGAGYAIWKYILPPLFLMLGQMIAIAGAIAFVIFLFLARHAIFKAIDNAAKGMHKAVIKSDVWAEFARQRSRMEANKVKFFSSKGNISSLKEGMKADAEKSEKEANDLKFEMGQLEKEAVILRSDVANAADKDSDDYHAKSIKLDRLAAKIEGAMYRYEQANILTQKYGARAATMTKLERKLEWVANKMDIKIMDFDNTIYLLKKDWEYNRKSAEATQAAKDTMLFDKSWEFDYALELVQTTIAADNAMTEMNLRDIDNITQNFSSNNDSVFAKLDALTQKIDSGEEKVIEAKKYNNPNYELTSKDKSAMSGFGGGNMF